jgi:hypothetical protein
VIAFRASSSGDLSIATASTTITKPGGAVATDLLIAMFLTTRNAITNPDIVGAPAGWTQVGSVVTANDGTNELSLYVFWALGTVSNLVFTNSQSTLKQAWVCAAFSGADGTNPIDSSATGNTGSAGVTTNAVTIVNTGAWHLIAAGDLNNHDLSASGFSGATNGPSALNASGTLFYNTTPKTAGDTPTGHPGISVSDPGDIVAAQPFALKPGAAQLIKKSPLRGIRANRPLYPGKGIVIQAPVPMAVPQAVGNSTLEWEVRLFDGGGKRVRLPLNWIDTLEFELGENGGMLNGTMQILAEWEALQLTGNERVDVWLWGVLVYRGRVRIPQSEEADPERKSPTLYGLMETLNGYQINRNLVYSTPTDIGSVFSDLVTQFIKRAGRLPNLVVDISGVSALGLMLSSFDPTGKNCTQALNDLVAVAPGSLIWGCDVDSGGNDRIYLRPRSATVKYKYGVGGTVKAFVYPQDVTQVRNAVFVTGGDLGNPNLAPNGSFEKRVAPGETTANLLASPSFEDATGGTIPNWIVTGNPTAYTSAARTGSVSVKIDNNPSVEGIAQEAFLPALPQLVNFAVYARVPVGQTWRIMIVLGLYDNTNTLIASNVFGAFAVPADGTWHRNSGQWFVTATPGIVKVRMSVSTDIGETGGGGVDDGLEVDDAALWFGTILPEGWQPGQSSNADFGALDFASQDIVAYDGDLSIKVVPTILSSGGYVEICTTLGARISVKSGRTYWLACYVSGRAVSPPIVALGLRAYSGTTLNGTVVGAQQTINSGLWSLVSVSVNVGGADSIEPFIRFYSGNGAYIDAFGVWLDNLPTVQTWYPDKDLWKYVTVADYAGSISAAAAASLTNYGLRQDAQSNAQIVDQATLDAFLVGWFNAHAVPAVQARLTIYGATAPMLLDGSVKVLNIPNEPPALFPSRIRYQIGEAITIDADLGNQRPDLAGLLRAANQRVLP